MGVGLPSSQCESQGHLGHQHSVGKVVRESVEDRKTGLWRRPGRLYISLPACSSHTPTVN